MRLLTSFLLALLIPAATLATETPTSDDLGSIHFPTSGKPEAQEHFLRGALLLHSFEYLDAREAFRAALEVEPGFAMAAWGEAMTYNHPIWLRQDLEAGRKALERFAPTPEERLALAPTEREKGYLQTIEILFGEGDKRTRDYAYADALGELARRFPDDLDAASFHALAILGTCHEGRDIPRYMQAAAIVEEVFDENPQHPGAAHYLIHSYDDPVHAPLGLRPARIYAEIAPAATHALHMPSHIFLALGLWDETASSNEDSWENSVRRVERDGLGIERKSFHALLWLEYAYLQQGRYREARELLAIMEEDAEASGSEGARNHLAFMRAHYLLETERWDDEVTAPEIDDLQLNPAATVLYTDGVVALRKGDIEAAAVQHEAIRKRRQDTLAATAEDPGVDGYVRAGELRTLEALIMELALEAQILLARGETDQAVERLAKAAELEHDASFGFGPPTPVKPALELFGEVLVDLGRYQEAREQLEKSLARNPRRVRSLSSLERAALGTGDHETAAKTHQILGDVWHRADHRTESEEPAAPAAR